MATVLLCVIAITASLSVAPVYGIQLTNVYGSVTDDDGIGIGNVNVKLFTPEGVCVANIQTNSYGHFITPQIELGTYSFRFSKIGYEEVVRNINIITFDQRLDSTVLPSGLSISASFLHIVANIGEIVSIPFTVTYAGIEGIEKVDFLVSTSPQISTRILQGNYEVIQIELAPKQSSSLQLELSIPSTIPENTLYNVSLTVIGETKVSKTFSVKVYTQVDNAEVLGKVVDDQDMGLADVTVEAYSTGKLVKSAITSNDGSFSLELPRSSTYSFEFSKDGYVKSVTSVSVDATDSQIFLDDVTLSNVLWLTSSILGTTANPGGKLVLPIMVSNIGSNIEPVSFSVSAPAGWTTKVVNEGGYQINDMSLSPSVNANLQLEVLVPLNADGNYTLMLTATGKTEAELIFKVHVEPVNEPLLNCQYLGKSANAGDVVRFEMTLTNPFSVDMPFRLSVNPIPANWTAFIKTIGGDYLTEVTLGSGQTVDLMVDVKSPSSTPTNKTYSFSITATAVNQNLSDTVPVTVTLTELANEITLTVPLPEVAVKAGSSINYPLTVSNLGATDRYLLLSIEPPSNWKAVFNVNQVEVTRLYLYGGNSSDLTVIVTPPSSVTLDTYTLPVKILSESGVVLSEANLTTTVIGSYDLNLQLSTYMASANSGESAYFTVTLVNSGYTTLTGITVNVTLPAEGWSATVTPVQVDTLKARESATFNIEVKTTENTLSGDYMISVKGESDQMGSGIGQVRLTVSASTSWGIYGIAVAATFIALLVGVFWKFKRR